MKKLLIVLVILTITFIPNIVVHASDLESSIEINKYTITFNTNGGNEIENQIILENELVNKTIPIKEGYIFLGWYSDSELNNKFDFNKPVNDNITLYAKWNKVINIVYINLTKPYVGDTTSMEKDANGSWNWDNTTNTPKAYVNNDLPYKVVETYWIEGFNGIQYETPFVGTFESGKNYYAQIYVEAKEGYQFNEVISVLVNGQNIDNLLELQNNSSYGTSYISVGKIIIPKEREIINNNIIKDDKPKEIIKENTKVENVLNNENNVVENITNSQDNNDLKLDNLSSNINHIVLNSTSGIKTNYSNSNNLYIWYTIAIISIIGLSVIYLKNSFKAI